MHNAESLAIAIMLSFKDNFIGRDPAPDRRLSIGTTPEHALKFVLLFATHLNRRMGGNGTQGIAKR